MNKKIIQLWSLVACVSVVQSLPVWADSQPSTKPASGSSGGVPSNVVTAPVGFCVGVVVGTPISLVRNLKYETIEMAKGLAGSVTDNEKVNGSPFLLVPCGLLNLPLATVIATARAIPWAWKNAWMAERPFSKEQFSLGEFDQETSTDSTK